MIIAHLWYASSRSRAKRCCYLCCWSLLLLCHIFFCCHRFVCFLFVFSAVPFASYLIPSLYPSHFTFYYLPSHSRRMPLYRNPLSRCLFCTVPSTLYGLRCSTMCQWHIDSMIIIIRANICWKKRCIKGQDRDNIAKEKEVEREI